MRIADSVVDLIGRTPMVRLRKIPPPGSAEVVMKLEMFNPGGSVKDRPALTMVQEAARRGELLPGGALIEATSGNTGIGLAMVGAALGYRVILVMPDNMSEERVQLLRAYGAEVVLTPEEEGMPGAIRKAEELYRSIPGSLLTRQFENPDNPLAHRLTTAQEILEDTEGQLDGLVATCGTGGTITGTGEVLRAALPHLIVVAVEPASSPVLSGGQPGRHRIPGMGPGFIPPVLNRSVYHRVERVTDDEALQMTVRLAREEGLLVGPSSGAGVVAALRLAQELGTGRRIVVIAPDGGQRYLSTGLFS